MTERSRENARADIAFSVAGGRDTVACMSVAQTELTTTYAAHIAWLQRTYAEALDAAGFEAAVIHSGTPLKRAEADDQYWPLRPVPHFQHWLPLAVPDCALIVRPGERPRLLWHRPYNYWEQPPEPDSDHWQSQFDIVVVDSMDALRSHLPREGVAVIGERRMPPEGWSVGDALNPDGLVEQLDKLRVHKSAYEVLCIAEANRRAAAGHKKVAEAFVAGEASELDLHLLFLATTRQDDPETPYKNIVALGPHAATLHHIAYGRAVSGRVNESLLIDAGASFQGYTSDITRTYVKGSGEAAQRFGELVARVERMQQRLCAEVAVGLPFPDLHERAHGYVAEILFEMGIVRLPAADIATTRITRAFFPHGLGHSLGLQCHDVGCAEIPPTEATDWLRNTTTIAPGQVFSIEPGIYFIEGKLAELRAGPHAADVDWRLVEELAQFGGVRIEDDIHVLGEDTPAANLTRAWLT
jgi:Xaa-Pro dipeptidase